MTSSKNVTTLALKRTKSPYIMIREDIYEALDLYTLSLYMAFRYESDFQKEDSIIRRSAKSLYEKAKISRRQFFLSLNILEDFGLVLRDSSSELNSISIYHVAQELHYFNTDCGVVQDVHGVVHDMHTYHYSYPLSNINITSDSGESPTIGNQEVIDAYHEVLPECPQIKVVDNQLKSQLNHLRKHWPRYQKEGKSFSIESFKDYLNYIKQHYPWFIKPYTTEGGMVKRNNLRVFTRQINITKIVNGEFSAG